MAWKILIHEGNNSKHKKCKWIPDFRRKQHTICCKQESLLLVGMCDPLFVRYSWRGVAVKEKFSSRPAVCSKAPVTKLRLLPASAFVQYESSLGIHSVPSSLHLASLTVLCWYRHLPRQEHEPSAVMHIRAMRSMHGQLLVTCCNCHVIMCSCDFRHSSADWRLLSAGSWLLSADCCLLTADCWLLTAICRSANWRYTMNRFWGACKYFDLLHRKQIWSYNFSSPEGM